jgi:hypothetical protein
VTYDSNSRLNFRFLSKRLFAGFFPEYSELIGPGTIIWCVFVGIFWSNQIKRGRSYYVVKNCEFVVPVPNLLAMCELAIFYTFIY